MLWVEMWMIQAEVMARQAQKQDERGKHQLTPHDRGRQAHDGAPVVSDKAGKVVWGQTGVMFSLHENEECEPWRRNTESVLH